MEENYDGYWNGELFVKQVHPRINFDYDIHLLMSRNSLLRKLFLHLNELMAQVIKLLSWLTILRDTLHTLLMHYSHLG